MENKTKPSFFKRASDAAPAQESAPVIVDNQDSDSATSRATPFGREFAPRGERRAPREASGSRAPRPSYGAPRDFRKAENRQSETPKQAPENVIFGVHPVREALEIGTALEKIYFKRTSGADDRRYGRRVGAPLAVENEALNEIMELAQEKGITVQYVPAEKLDFLTRRNNHQGVVAVAPAIEYADINAILELIEQKETPALILALDGVTDVRNFGAIARSAECAGVDALIVSAKNSAPVNAEAMKSSAGALSIVPVCRVGSMRNTLKSLQMAGLTMVGATEKAHTLLYESALTGPTVIVMGGEERGISSEILKMCDIQMAIPLLGKIGSLNVSAAAAVMLFEAMRQRFEAIE